MVGLLHYEILPNGAVLLGTGIMFTALAGVAVVFRLIGRWVANFDFGSDDYLVAAGYAFWLVEQGLGLRGIHDAMQASTLTDPLFIDFRRLTYISAPFYWVAMALLRLGILHYYRRIFSTEGFRRVSGLVRVVLILFYIAAFLVECFACLPAEADWDATVKGRCVNFTRFWLWSAAIECVFDVVLISLPLVRVFQTMMPTKRKIVISLIFLLGAFSVVTGIVRVIVTMNSETEGQLNVAADILWMQVHNGTAFLSACLPTYRPLLAAARSRVTGYWSSITKEKSSSRGSTLPQMNRSGSTMKGSVKSNYKETDDEDIALVEANINRV